MITNTSCTVFHLNSDGTFLRHVLSAVYFRDAENLAASGTVLSDGDEAVIFVPQEMLTGYGQTWHISAKDYICRGTVDFEAAQKNIPELRKKYGAYSVTSCEELFYGSRRLWHIKIRAKP